MYVVSFRFYQTVVVVEIELRGENSVFEWCI